MKIRIDPLAVSAFSILAAIAFLPSSARAQVRPEVVEQTGSSPAVLPEIWKNISARERLNLVRAAELDGTRQLMERINGIAIDSETSVMDMAQTDDSIKAMLRESITGVRTVGSPTYLPDGRIEVVRKVHLTQLIRRIVETYTRPEGGNMKADSETTTTEKEVVFDVTGVAAIRGSDGHKRVLAQRAAQVDAYRRLAERTGSTRLSSETTIADLATTNDSIRSSVSKTIKNAEPISIKYLPDNSAEVTLRINLDPIVRVIAKRVKDGQVTLISDKIEQLIVEETGVGAPPDNMDLEVEVHIESIIEQSLKLGGGQ
jgi:outer membrane protein FlgP